MGERGGLVMRRAREAYAGERNGGDALGNHSPGSGSTVHGPQRECAGPDREPTGSQAEGSEPGSTPGRRGFDEGATDRRGRRSGDFGKAVAPVGSPWVGTGAQTRRFLHLTFARRNLLI